MTPTCTSFIPVNKKLKKLSYLTEDLKVLKSDYVKSWYGLIYPSRKAFCLTVISGNIVIKDRATDTVLSMSDL